MRGKIGIVAATLMLLAAARCTWEVPQERVPATTASDEARRLYGKGRDALERLDRETARSYFRRAVAEDPEFALAHLGMALAADTAADRQGSLGIAMALIPRVAQGERMMIRVEQARDDGDDTTLSGQLNALVESYPGETAAQVLLGDYYLDRGNRPAALRCYARAVAQEPALPSTHRGMARAYASLGRHDQAVVTLARHLELMPDNPAAHRLLAEALMKAGRFEDSIARYEQLLALDPDDVAAHVGIGHDLLFLGRADEAVERLRRLLDGSADDARRGQIRVWLAAFRLHEEAHAEALEELRAAHALAEGRDAGAAARLLVAIGDVLLDSGAIGEAAVHFSRAAEVLAATAVPQAAEEARASGAYHEARVALARGDLAAARTKLTEYRQASAGLRRPEAKHAWRELEARVALSEGDLAVALGWLERENRRDPRILYLAAEAYQAAGRTDEARASCTAALNFNEPRFELALVRPKARQLLAKL